MKIACIQVKSTDNLDYNIKKILKYIHICIKKKADLIITPEATTFLYDDKYTLVKNSFAFSKDFFLKTISGIAKKYNKWILIGSLIIKVGKNKLVNRSVLIDKNGKIRSYYDKIHMYDVILSKREKYFESKTFLAGNKIKAFNLPWGKLGLSICYDLRFPNLYRKLAKEGSIFLSVPSAFTETTGKRHWHALLRARAIENFCYIFAPAQGGTHYNGRKTFGHSLIISPDGKIIKELNKKEGVITASIDSKAAKKFRSIIPSLKSN